MRYGANIYIFLVLIGITLITIGCRTTTETPPTYNFQAVYSQLMEIDNKHNTSFYIEVSDDPISEEKISSILLEIESIRKNNERMNISQDYAAINLLLDSRENILLAQRNYRIFAENFVGEENCNDANQDYLAIQYVQRFVSQGIRANSRLDKLITESANAREIVLGDRRPSFYDTDYGKISLFARGYMEILNIKCNVPNENTS
jgi:hypothetical protein